MSLFESYYYYCHAHSLYFWKKYEWKHRFNFSHFQDQRVRRLFFQKAIKELKKSFCIMIWYFVVVVWEFTENIIKLIKKRTDVLFFLTLITKLLQRFLLFYLWIMYIYLIIWFFSSRFFLNTFLAPFFVSKNRQAKFELYSKYGVTWSQNTFLCWHSFPWLFYHNKKQAIPKLIIWMLFQSETFFSEFLESLWKLISLIEKIGKIYPCEIFQ